MRIIRQRLAGLDMCRQLGQRRPVPGEILHELAGQLLLRQIEFATFDLRLHRDFDPTQTGRVMDVLNAVRSPVSTCADSWVSVARSQAKFSMNWLGSSTASHSFQAGLFLLRQIEFATFDLRLHRDFDPTQTGRVMDRSRHVPTAGSASPGPRRNSP
jgi:Zn-dependent oligopeptidase